MTTRTMKCKRWLAIIATATILSVPAVAQPASGDLKGGDAVKTVRSGKEAAFSKRIAAAYRMLGSGNRDAGFSALRSALSDAARSQFQAFAIGQYVEAAQKFHQAGQVQRAETLLTDALGSPAAKVEMSELSDFFLMLGMVKTDLRKYQEAMPFYLQATHRFARYFGKYSRELMFANDKLAVAMSGAGNPAASTNLAKGNYELARKTLGDDDRLTWKLANNYADMLRIMGAPSRAVELDTFVLGKRTAHYGKNHFNVMVSANNLAQNYLDLADYPQAKRYFQQNRDIAVALDKKDADYVGQADAWLLFTQVASGEKPLDDAARTRLEAIVADQQYPDILRIKAARRVADQYDKSGNRARAKQLREKAYDISATVFSPQHPTSYAVRIDMANSRAATDPAGAAADFAKLDREMIAWINREVGTAGDRIVAEATRALADEMLYGYAHLAEHEASAVPAFADAVRRWPTIEDGKRDTLRKIARIIDPADTATHHLLKNGLRLSFEVQELLASGSDIDGGMNRLEQLRGIDARLNERLAKLHVTPKAIEPPLPSPRQLLGSKEALVSYFITRKWRADRQSSDPLEDTVLYALVSRKDADPKLFNLGDPRLRNLGAEYQIARLRTARASTESADTPATSKPGFAKLYTRLIAPLEPSLKDVSTLYIVPDGQLFAVPFPLLRDDAGVLIEDRYTLRMLTRPEALYGINETQKMPHGGVAVLAGGLDYRNGKEAGAEPLPATKSEIDDIAKVLGKNETRIEMLTGEQATEPVLRKDVEAASIVHLATHGSYESEDTGGATGIDALWQSGVILSRSGDRRAMKRDDDDGRLYAFEVMDWDLSNIGLFVLSACETGRGQETFVGGLRGLPTAIGIAGAKRSLLALWPVDDLGTSRFMVRFYEKLVAGETYPEALRKTRRDAINGNIEGASDPSVWAAFVLFEN